MASRTHVARPVDSHPEQALDAVATLGGGILMMLLQYKFCALPILDWLVVCWSKMGKSADCGLAAVVSSRGAAALSREIVDQILHDADGGGRRVIGRLPN
jgi:hypothetical protein